MKGMVKTYRGYNSDFTESQLHQVALVNGRWFAVKPTTYVEDYEYADFAESELVESGYECSGYGVLDSELDEAFARDKAEKLHHSHDKNGAIYYESLDSKSKEQK